MHNMWQKISESMNNNNFIHLTVNEVHVPEYGWRKTCDTVALNVSEIVTIEDRTDNNYGNRRRFSCVKMKNVYGYEVKENINEINGKTE